MTTDLAIPGPGVVDAEVVDAELIEDEQSAPLGSVVIEWPQPSAGNPDPRFFSAIPGCLLMVTDALTGKPILTVSRVEIHADANARVTADLTMWADPDGAPLFDSAVMYRRGGEIITGTFRFYLGAMTVRESPGSEGVMERIKASGVYWGRSKVVEVGT